jgi:hypothetical protein
MVFLYERSAMRKRMLFAVVGSFMAVLPVSADCVKCDIFQDCPPDVNGTACECRIRSVNGSPICRESGICGPDGGCANDGGPQPVSLVKPFYIEGVAISQLSAREPMLALVIAGSLVPDSKGKMRQLDTDDYNGGTFRTEDGEVFFHRGSFTPHETGEVIFRFTIESLNGQEKIEYFGVLSSGGRHIQFSKVQTDLDKTRRIAEDLDLAPATN